VTIEVRGEVLMTQAQFEAANAARTGAGGGFSELEQEGRASDGGSGDCTHEGDEGECVLLGAGDEDVAGLLVVVNAVFVRGAALGLSVRERLPVDAWPGGAKSDAPRRLRPLPSCPCANWAP
jgi:hypothetical protein